MLGKSKVLLVGDDIVTVCKSEKGLGSRVSEQLCRQGQNANEEKDPPRKRKKETGSSGTGCVTSTTLWESKITQLQSTAFLKSLTETLRRGLGNACKSCPHQSINPALKTQGEKDPWGSLASQSRPVNVLQIH